MSLPAVAEINVEVPGPFAIHNMPCTVCRERHAVLDLDCGLMEPCWICQDEGWVVGRVQGRIRRWVARMVLSNG